VLLPRQQAKLARGAKDKEHAMSQTPNTAIAVIGVDIGKNSFHVVGHDVRGAIVLARRPALTAPARDAIDVLRAGTKERPLARTKELRDIRSKR
jgi:hypothetical protein